MPDVSNITASVNASDLQWYDCRIESAGPGEDETIWVKMTDTGGAFKQVWFTALPAIRRQVLETALAALQSSLICHVGVTGTDDQSHLPYPRQRSIVPRGLSVFPERPRKTRPHPPPHYPLRTLVPTTGPEVVNRKTL